MLSRSSGYRGDDAVLAADPSAFSGSTEHAVKRPKQHEIDTAAQNVLRSLLPRSWVVREQVPDYGIDCEVEIFKEGRSTGTFLAIQLKGTERPQYSGKYLHFRLDTEVLCHYYSTVSKPVYLVVVDIKRQQAFWICTQLYVLDVIEKEKPDWRSQSTITVRIPLANDLSDPDKLEEAARADAEKVHILRHGIPHWAVVAQVEGIFDDPEAIEHAMLRSRRQETEMGLHAAELYIQGGQRAQATARLLETMRQAELEEEPSNALMCAILYSYCANPMKKDENRTAVNLFHSALGRSDSCASQALVLVARGRTAYLEFFYRFQRALDVDRLAQVAEVQGRGTDQVLRGLQLEEAQAYGTAGRELKRTISDALDKGWLGVACHLMVDLANSNMLAYTFTRVRLGADLAAPLLEAADETLVIALRIAAALDDPELVCHTMQSQANVLQTQDDQTYKDVLDEMGRIASQHQLRAYEQSAVNLKRSLEQRAPLPDGPVQPEVERELTDEEEFAIIHSLIDSAGVDLQDENDEVSRIVRIGLRDRNPQRVLRFCAHLHVATGSYGIPGEILALPTAGSKFLYCDEAEACLYGQELDRLLDLMRRQHCGQCNSREARPAGWKWSRQWQRAHDARRPTGLQECIERLYEA